MKSMPRHASATHVNLLNRWSTRRGTVFSLQRIRKALGLPLRWQLLLLETLVLLAAARATAVFFPFKRFANRLGQLNHETPPDICERDNQVAADVARAVAMISPHTVWCSNCFAQAIAGKIMLKRRQIPSTLYLGLKKSGPKMEAHAWLRAGDTTVCGGGQVEEYSVVATYGS